MADREKLFEEFAPHTEDDWLKKLEKELKGKSVDELAQRSGAEEIYIEPFFTRVEEHQKQQAIKLAWLLSYRADNTWQIIEDPKRQLKDYRIDAAKYHNKGANATQELAIALAKGNELLSKGTSIDAFLGKKVFHFAAGNDFFLEIAKFRAFRLLWANIVQQYKPSDEKSYFAYVSASTSLRDFSDTDEYTNLLRATTQAMSALIGGADAVYTVPFNAKTMETDFSKRLSLNLHHLLKHESKLDKVVDAGGGSWYLAKLTETLAQRAWAFFQEIESKGGYEKAKDYIESEIERVSAIRQQHIVSGKEIRVGVNKYMQKSEA